MSKKKNIRRVRRSHDHVSLISTPFITENNQGNSTTSPVRNQRIEHLILEELRWILASDVSDPQVQNIRIVSAHLSLDGSYAKLSYVVREHDRSNEKATARQTGDALKRASGFIRSRLALSLNLKRTPQLGFVFLGLIDAQFSAEAQEEDAS